MAKLPPIRRLLKEEFKDQPWIDRLLYPLNLFLSGMTSALHNQLSIADNLFAQANTILVYTASVPTTGATFSAVQLPNYVALQTSVSYALNFNVKPLGVHCVQAIENVGNPSTNQYAVQPNWNFDSKNQAVTVSAVSGLNPNTSYYLTLITWMG